jgi:ATP-dependent DNA ligase
MTRPTFPWPARGGRQPNRPTIAVDPRNAAIRQAHRSPRHLGGEPELLAEIEYRTKSAEGNVRHPCFQGLMARSECFARSALSWRSPRIARRSRHRIDRRARRFVRTHSLIQSEVVPSRN